MLKIQLPLLILFVSLNAHSQLVSNGPPPKNPPKTPSAREEQNQKCIYKKRYTAEQRALLYPFHKAGQVKLVSYKYETGSSPFADTAIDFAKFKEEKLISKAGIDSLTNILYNYTWRGTFTSYMDAKCFMPRNAVLFIDATGKVFAFIEICFGCQKYVVSDKRIKAGDFCEGKYELLKKFFIKAGIGYGTTEEEP